MKLKRTLLMALTLALVVFSFAACQPAAELPEEPPVEENEPVTILIAAAASLESAFSKELIPAFIADYPWITVEGTYDSSGKLQTQIESGLEADLFFSAATKQMNALDEQGMMASDSIVSLLENDIVLIIPKGSSSNVTDFNDITNADRIAVGDPASVPAGQYAEEVFTNLGNWNAVQAKASLGTNVTEVLSWVAAGSADAGVVYATDAAGNQDVEVIAKAPEGSLATPIVYPVGILAGSQHMTEAEAFITFLQGDTARVIFENYGFNVK